MPLTLKQFATKGGKARAAKLSKERRIKIASDAGKASALQRASKIQKLCQSPESSENKV